MLIVERIEGGVAVCETAEGRRELPLTELPAEVREGDCLIRVDGAWKIHREETLRRRQRNHSRTAALFRRRTPEESE